MRALILLALLSSAPAFALDYGLGLGLESRLTKDVNPAFSTVRTLGQFFQEIRFHPFTISLELGQEHAAANAGGLTVDRATVSVQTWARYNFLDFSMWAPYLTVGAGVFLDRVTSTLPGDEDVRRGTRGLWGLGGGLTKTFFDHLLLEAEMRATFVREQRDLGVSLLARLGYLF